MGGFRLVCLRYTLLFSVQLACMFSGTIEGTVFEHPSGMRVRSASVLISKAHQRSAVAEVETDDEGRFGVPGLSAGKYRVEVTKANYGDTVLYVRVAPNLTRVIVSVVRYAVIAGRVTNPQGEPVSGVKVSAMLKVTREQRAQRVVHSHRGPSDITDSDGNYRLYGVPPGQYAVAVAYGALGGSFAFTGGSGVLFYPDNVRPRLFAIAGGEEYRGIDIVILPTSRYRVSGRVLPAPKAKFSLALSPVNEPALLIANALTMEADGSFRFDGIPPGSYQIFASGPTVGVSGVGAILDSEPLFGEAQVEVQQDIEGLSIPVKKGRSVPFALRQANSDTVEGHCPESVHVTLSPLDHFGALVRTAELRTARETMISDLHPGRYWLSVSELGETCYAMTNTIDLRDTKREDHVVVLISTAGSIRGRVKDLSTAAQLAVVLVAADAIAGMPPVQIAFVDSEYVFTFENLRPGRYRIATVSATEMQKPGWRSQPDQMREIEIRSGVNDVELGVPEDSK
jgi:uncharacterized protein (DUF2141 family)